MIFSIGSVVSLTPAPTGLTVTVDGTACPVVAFAAVVTEHDRAYSITNVEKVSPVIVRAGKLEVTSGLIAAV